MTRIERFFSSMENLVDDQRTLHYRLRDGSRQFFCHLNANIEAYLSTFHLSYTGQLVDYIIRYKRRPSDIKHWPYGPYWPRGYAGLLVNTPRHIWACPKQAEPLITGEFDGHLFAISRTFDNQVTPYAGKWRGIQIAYDSDKSPRDCRAAPVPEACCPTLMFESRFECGNLRQARRVGQFEYELVLKSDFYTVRHTQWYYFQVSNVVPGVTYKFKIVNLLKHDSLYNQGMRPLLYSEHDAQEKQIGWVRTGHHISYSRNLNSHNCPLLERNMAYYELEWQMEFPNPDDLYYLAHCYPYTFTDLKEDLEVLTNCEERAKVTRREVMCETRAGNSCFLLTVTNFDCSESKKAVVITARVHPGESQSSWMMKGLIEFITGPDPVATALRDKFIFKIVPMINPDGVIVGNYRCSLAGRDLNRNYRHPRKEHFPTVWHLKNMVDNLSKKHEIILYCDLHGHSRKPNVFMYGNNTSTEGDPSPQGVAKAFISERLFPWLMCVRSPDMFHFKSCKFHIRRCKESTGRVVMWRQLNVLNSFTLEATFSGTVLDREQCRHFNIIDYMNMGKVLAETIDDYHTLQQDQNKQSQAILGLTRAIMEQILASKGRAETQASNNVQKDANPNGPEKNKKSSNVIKQGGATFGSKVFEEDRKNGQRPTVCKTDETVHLLDTLTPGRSMDDCFSVLGQIDIQNAIQESDSSDSDSESEPEMKPQELKGRRKKRKSKKQHEKPGDSEKNLSKDGDNKSAERVTRFKSLSDSTTLENYRNTRHFNGFVSKYEGRHNGGVPCFTEERSLERAAKRMSELRRKHDHDQTHQKLSYSSLDDRRITSLAHDTSSKRSHENDEGDPNIPSQLGMHVKTTYIHAERFLETRSCTSDNLLSPDQAEALKIQIDSFLRSPLNSRDDHNTNSQQDRRSVTFSTEDTNGNDINNHSTANYNKHHRHHHPAPRQLLAVSDYSSRPSLPTTATATLVTTSSAPTIGLTTPSPFPSTNSCNYTAPAPTRTLFTTTNSLTSHTKPTSSVRQKTLERTARHKESTPEFKTIWRQSQHPKLPAAKNIDSLANLNHHTIENIQKLYPTPKNEQIQRSDNSEHRSVLGNLDNQSSIPATGRLVSRFMQNEAGLTGPHSHTRHKNGSSSQTPNGPPVTWPSHALTSHLIQANRPAVREKLTNQNGDDVIL